MNMQCSIFIEVDIWQEKGR